MKKRILLHSMTFKRDFGMIYILSKLLESLGCECIIANNTNLCRFFMKLWNPHAVFFVTHSRANSLKRTFPNSKLFHLSAEGGAFHVPAELSIIDDKTTLENIDVFYLWGQKTQDLIKDKVLELKEKQDISSEILNKCKVVGSPRLDIVRFFNKTSIINKKKIRIGFVGNCYYLNNIKFNTLESMTMHQFSEKADGQRTLDEIKFQISLMELYFKLIKSLDPEKYLFSIRPYPLEGLKAYEYFPANVEVDTSLEFSSWLNRQDIIIGSTSTTITQIAMSEKPYINLDVMLKRRKWEYNDIFADSLRHHQAQDVSQIIDMIKNYQNYKFINKEMKTKLNYCYNASAEGSILYQLAKDIFLKLEGSKVGKFHIPKGVLNKIINLWDAFVKVKSKKALEKDYSYFCFAQISEGIIKDLDQVVKNILTAETSENKIKDYE